MTSALKCLAGVTLLVCATGAPAADEAARKCSERELGNLVAFSKLLGYVRYFHPSDEAAGVNWDIVAIEGIQAVEKAESDADLAARLEKFFQPLAPTVKVFPKGKRPADGGKVAKPEGATRLLVWRHLSVPVPRQPDKVSSQRIDLKSEELWPRALKIEMPTPDPVRPFEAELGGGVSCLVPLALHADVGGTLPRGNKDYLKKFSSRPQDFVPSGKDRATRLAAVALAWNSAQHFYPYFDAVKTDWPGELRRSLARAATDPDDQAYFVTMRRLMAALQDGHATVSAPGVRELSCPPVRWDWIKNRLVVVWVGKDGGQGLRPGDVVLTIDGQATDRLLESLEQAFSSPTPWLKRRSAMTAAAIGKKDSTIELEVQTDGEQPRKVTLKRALAFAAFRDLGSEPRPAPIGEIKPGFWYIDTERASQKEFEATVPKLEKAAGIVFDVRGYPRIELQILLQHFLDKPTLAGPVYLPAIAYPDRQYQRFLQGRSSVMEPKAPRLRATAVYLTDTRAISAAETYLMMVAHHKLGAIVGSATAGTTGNVRVVSLPGGYEIQFTGIKAVNYDGSQFHGRGVRPTVAVERTLKGVAQERDEVLEQALKLLAS